MVVLASLVSINSCRAVCYSDGLEDSREAEKGVSYSRFLSTIGPENELVNVRHFGVVT